MAKLKVWLVLILLWVIIGSASIAIKIAIDTIKLVSILNKRQWKEATIIGAALILGGQGLLTWGEQYLSSSVTALLFSTVSIWVLMLGKILYGDGLKRFTVLGVIIGSIGFVILLFPSLAAQFVELNSTDPNFEFIGVIALVVAALVGQSDLCIHLRRICLLMT